MEAGRAELAEELARSITLRCDLSIVGVTNVMQVQQQTQMVTWLSQQFHVYSPLNVTWNQVSGIYIFAGINSKNLWEAFYIGQAESFADRLQGHERWAEAVRLGATHIHAAVVPLEANRDRLEKALIQAYQPQLNTHYRPMR